MRLFGKSSEGSQALRPKKNLPTASSRQQAPTSWMASKAESLPLQVLHSFAEGPT